MEPRKPTQAEKEQLIAYNTQRFGDDREQQAGFTECAAIAVFDDYITGGPGYAGKVMVVVWDGAPSFYDVYTWLDGEIRYCEKEQ